MLPDLINDINKALDNNAYFAALTLALTLPDICGKAAYSNKTTRRRYIDWVDEYISIFEQCPCEDCEKRPSPHLTGEVIYSLRNSMLHQGTPNINSREIKEEANQIDVFTLVIEKKNRFDIYSDASSIEETFVNGCSVELKRTFRVNIRRLCLILTMYAADYYNENKDKFNFFNYNVIDWDEEVERIRKLNAR